MQELPHQRNDRRWAVVRITLGVLQMFGAAFSLTLLATTGANTLALSAVVATGVLTTISVLLFGSRRPRWFAPIKEGDKEDGKAERSVSVHRKLGP